MAVLSVRAAAALAVGVGVGIGAALARSRQKAGEPCCDKPTAGARCC